MIGRLYFFTFLAAAAIFTVAAALFYGLARGGIHRAAVRPFGFFFANGAKNFVVKLFYKLFKIFPAVFTAVLKYGHSLILFIFFVLFVFFAFLFKPLQFSERIALYDKHRDCRRK